MCVVLTILRLDEAVLTSSIISFQIPSWATDSDEGSDFTKAASYRGIDAEVLSKVTTAEAAALIMSISYIPMGPC